jgi:TPR repeat protein
MKTPLTFLLSLTFLFLFSGSVYGDDFDDGKDAMRRGDYKTGIGKFKLLAKQGHTEAQFTLGVLYSHGIGVTLSGKESVKWFERAAELGHVPAQYSLGLMFYKGDKVQQNYMEAKKWFLKAAKLGYAEAQSQLSLMYYTGLGVIQDFKKAEKYGLMAAEQGDAQAQTTLSTIYSEGNGVPINDEESVKWLQLAANQGFADAQFLLGFRYETGLGVQKNHMEALNWYRKAAKRGNAKAQSKLDETTEKMAEATLNKNKNSSVELNQSASIFLECKTVKIKLLETDILELDIAKGKLIWVEDDVGFLVNLPMKIEDFSDNIIRASYTMKEMLARTLSSNQEFDKKQLANLREMKSTIEYFKNVVPQKLIESGLSPEESKKKAEGLFDSIFGSKQYVELDRNSGEILWIQPHIKSQIVGGNDVQRKVKKGKCMKLGKKF